MRRSCVASAAPRRGPTTEPVEPAADTTPFTKASRDWAVTRAMYSRSEMRVSPPPSAGHRPERDQRHGRGRRRDEEVARRVDRLAEGHLAPGREPAREHAGRQLSEGRGNRERPDHEPQLLGRRADLHGIQRQERQHDRHADLRDEGQEGEHGDRPIEATRSPREAPADGRGHPPQGSGADQFRSDSGNVSMSPPRAPAMSRTLPSDVSNTVIDACWLMRMRPAASCPGRPRA